MTVTDLIHGELNHERVITSIGARSGAWTTVAVHSTVLGPALGGCRLWHYEDASAAFHDALRLSSAMTLKNSAAGIDHGGGKSVIGFPDGEKVDARRREAALLDLADLVEEFAGSYLTAEDVGTTERDMLIVAGRTSHVVGLPAEHGGAGEPAAATALGVYASLRATLGAVFEHDDPRGRKITISGLGQVGGALARRLAAEGAQLALTDVNPARRSIAEELGGQWLEPEAAYTQPGDLFVPAGVGGVLTAERIEQLEVRAVVGPANNPLAERSGADLLHSRGILYAPDFIVNAGGVIMLALAAEGVDAVAVDERISRIADTLAQVFAESATAGTSPLIAAERIARERLAAAGK